VAALEASDQDLRERYVGISYCWVADVLPGRHLIVFAPRWNGTDIASSRQRQAWKASSVLH